MAKRRAFSTFESRQKPAGTIRGEHGDDTVAGGIDNGDG
jgi:hypothetical protein